MRFSRLLLPVWLGGLAWFAARAQESPPPPSVYTGLLSLVRYDSPIGFSDGFAPTRQAAVRRPGPEAVDWPAFTLNGEPLFHDSPTERRPLKLHPPAEAGSPFQLRTDEVIQPGNHWFRAMSASSTRRYLYTADRHARTTNGNDTMAGRYELWTFPVRISGEGGPRVKNVTLKCGSTVLYQKDGPWRSLTLLLPANEPGRAYELTVDGRPPLTFDLGFWPPKLGAPRERLYTIDQVLQGEGPKVRVVSPVPPEVFPNLREWEADVAALRQAPPAPLKFERPAGMSRYLGVEVPRSPFTVYAVELPSGRSSGFFRQGPAGFADGLPEYAEHLAALGYDAVFAAAGKLPEARDPISFENEAAALARHGVKLGLQYDTRWARPSLANPCLPILAHTLPEWHAPLYRSLSLAAQRFGRLPNFIGFDIGSSNAGYAAEGSGTALPTPDRPWGEAMMAFMGRPQPAIPRPPGSEAAGKPYEYAAANGMEFRKYLERYDAAFQQNGYFAEAVREVSKRLVFTTGTYGSAAPAAARGGWSQASAPGRSIFMGLNLQQAYDWNPGHAARPLQNVALTDRLNSYWEKKPTWSLLDNSHFLYGREAYQRACALALTRGIQGLGTNALPPEKEDPALPGIASWQSEMNAWMHRYGGVFARLQPMPSIGVYFNHLQATQGEGGSSAGTPGGGIEHGSHGAKVDEALFFCHAAGWPARIVTYQELMRAPLTSSMQVLLIVGAPAGGQSGLAGLETPFQQFLARGGRILTDDESDCPAPSTRLTMHVIGGLPESGIDPTPLLFRRNAENIAKLRQAMEGAAPPVAVSDSPTIWAVPAEAGDVQYLTVVNQGFIEGWRATEMLLPADPRATHPELWKTKGNASRYVVPQTGTLQWHTDRPIYDLRQARRLSPDEAARVDLTKDAFQTYALPPAPIVAPTMKLSRGTSGFYEGTVQIAFSGGAMAGVPVKVEVVRGAETVEVYGATGMPIRLPIHERDGPGAFQIRATELLSGLAGETSLTLAAVPPVPATLQNAVKVREAAAVTRFAKRTNPLVIGLTPEQEHDPAAAEAARRLAAWYRAQGRTVSIRQVAPGGVVESLQPWQSPHRFPQWKTVAADLILMGQPGNNVLLLDQTRGELFPLGWRVPSAGTAEVLYTRSPFVGECDAINLLATDSAGLNAAVQAVLASGPASPPAPANRPAAILSSPPKR